MKVEGFEIWKYPGHRTKPPRYLKLCSCRSEHCSSMCWIAMIPCAWRQGFFHFFAPGKWFFLESEKWKGMEKNCHFCRVLGRLVCLVCPSHWGHESPQIIHAQFRVITRPSMKYACTLIFEVPKTPKTDLKNKYIQGVYWKPRVQYSTNLLTDGCCVGTRGRLLLVTVGHGRRAVWEVPSMLELSVCAHVGSSKLVFAAARAAMEVLKCV